MGVHHAWGRTYKDLFQRFHAMLGEKQRYQNGFDCQGLWIEVEVEKELGFNNKRDIEAFGIDRFVELCKERVDQFAAIQTEQSKRLGYWMDWDNSYYTNSDENNYTIWAFLAECHRRGLVYRGHDVMPWCPRCGTGLSNMEIATEGYRELRHLSLTVRLPDHQPRPRGRGPAGLDDDAVDPVEQRRGGRQPGAHLPARGGPRRPALVGQPRLATARGRRRAGPRRGDRRRAGRPHLRRARSTSCRWRPGVEHRVVPWGEVSDEEGTGIVHIAPGCGQEDFALSKEHGLAVLDPIDESGIFRAGYGWQSGRFAGATPEPKDDIAYDVAANLEEKGLLVAREQYSHHYPVCWRCQTQLVFRLVDEWFIAMDPLRAPLSEATRSMAWLPEGIGLEERELDWLRNMGDWMISKKRYYGLALPIWECSDCDGWEVIGSKDELKERAVAGWEEFEGHSPHRPWIDAVEVACSACGGRARRTVDVGNPWLDAGIVGLSTMGWMTDREDWARWFPADLITESFPGQFRNWFYALITESTVMTGQAPARNLFAYALMRDEHGEEMHKSRGNAIPFDEAADRIGADVMRWLFCTTNPATNVNFGYGPAHEAVRRFLLPLWNTYAFFTSYARLDGWTPDGTDDASGARTLLDRWILSRLDTVVGEAREALAAYDPPRAARAVEAFVVEELSGWYVRRNRRRFWKGELDADKRAAFATLHRVLVDVTRLLAPMLPHVADALWENLVVSVDANAPDSVHLSSYPEPRDGARDAALEAGDGPRPPSRGARPCRAQRIGGQDAAAAGRGARPAPRWGDLAGRRPDGLRRADRDGARGAERARAGGHSRGIRPRRAVAVSAAPRGRAAPREGRRPDHGRRTLRGLVAQ